MKLKQNGRLTKLHFVHAAHHACCLHVHAFAPSRCKLSNQLDFTQSNFFCLCKWKIFVLIIQCFVQIDMYKSISTKYITAKTGFHKVLQRSRFFEILLEETKKTAKMFELKIELPTLTLKLEDCILIAFFRRYYCISEI